VEGGLPLEELAERGKRCRCSLVRGALKRGMGVIGWRYICLVRYLLYLC